MKQPSLHAMPSDKQSFCCKQGASEHKGKDPDVDVLVIMGLQDAITVWT